MSKCEKLGYIGGILMLASLITITLINSCTYEYRTYYGGNQKIFDTTWSYKYADIYLPNGQVKTIEIETWNDYEGEQIQIHSKNGVNYIVSSFNTILRSK